MTDTKNAFPLEATQQWLRYNHQTPPLFFAGMAVIFIISFLAFIFLFSLLLGKTLLPFYLLVSFFFALACSAFSSATILNNETRWQKWVADLPMKRREAMAKELVDFTDSLSVSDFLGENYKTNFDEFLVGTLEFFIEETKEIAKQNATNLLADDLDFILKGLDYIINDEVGIPNAYQRMLNQTEWIKEMNAEKRQKAIAKKRLESLTR